MLILPFCSLTQIWKYPNKVNKSNLDGCNLDLKILFMKIYKNISSIGWEPLVSRPLIDAKEMEARVQSVLDKVKMLKDEAVHAFTQV